MATIKEKQLIVSIPSLDMDVFNVIAEKFGWKASIYEKQEKTSFQKSQEDIKAGRINTYKNSDELFKKLKCI